MGTQQLVILCSYGYDPLDRLISQLQPDAPAHQRFYCKSRLATEIQGAIGFSVFQNNDLLLAQHKNQGGAVESTLLATDQQRSVLHTFTADQQQHPIAYSPYGHRQAESGLTSLLGFNGERPDPVTGHYLLGNGYRAFNPVLMRFNSPDSFSPFGKGGLNCYTYCSGDSMNRADTTGHNWYKAVITHFKANLPEELFGPMVKALQNSKAFLQGTVGVEQLATSLKNTNEQILFNNTIAHQYNKIHRNLAAIKAAVAAPNSPQRNDAILRAKSKIEQAVRISNELDKYVPNTRVHQYKMSIVHTAEQMLASRLNTPNSYPYSPDPVLDSDRVRSA